MQNSLVALNLYEPMMGEDVTKRLLAEITDCRRFVQTHQVYDSGNRHVQGFDSTENSVDLKQRPNHKSLMGRTLVKSMSKVLVIKRRCLSEDQRRSAVKDIDEISISQTGINQHY